MVRFRVSVLGSQASRHEDLGVEIDAYGQKMQAATFVGVFRVVGFKWVGKQLELE